ncbi:hypothetical protein GGR21_000069 [Dysgonomonas hofstadii]|uniref:Uncharacterized protein n=1 Tax=Dysgonomonas hofstadii TaxID=637886 RepID=A0A840CL93_9BACT|nr:hypothetical protein [Dysgonomonas hofstadii]
MILIQTENVVRRNNSFKFSSALEHIQIYLYYLSYPKLNL